MPPLRLLSLPCSRASRFLKHAYTALAQTSGAALIRILLAGILVVLTFAPVGWAQAGPVEGGHEWQVWTGGGHGLNGSQQDDGVFNLGGRFGIILTAPHGPGFLRGRLEYAVDVVPVFLVTQRSGTAYGAGVNPFAFKWALDTHKKVVPYFEIGGGTLFTN